MIGYIRYKLIVLFYSLIIFSSNLLFLFIESEYVFIYINYQLNPCIFSSLFNHINI